MLLHKYLFKDLLKYIYLIFKNSIQIIQQWHVTIYNFENIGGSPLTACAITAFKKSSLWSIDLLCIAWNKPEKLCIIEQSFSHEEISYNNFSNHFIYF